MINSLKREDPHESDQQKGKLPDRRVKITDTLGSKSEREEYYLKRRICKNE